MLDSPQVSKHPAPFIDEPGVYNLRHLGGYEIPGDQIMRKGLLFRSEALSRIDKKRQRELLERLNVKLVVDLRTPEERRLFDPTEIPEAAGSLTVPLPDISRFGAVPRSHPEYLKLAYLSILMEQPRRLSTVLHALLDPANWPVLYHCAAGKDRTGIVSMLLLALAGADRETIAHDYALTELAVAKIVAEAGVNPSIDVIQLRSLPTGLVGSRPETAIAVLEKLETTFGSVTDYAGFLGIRSSEVDRFQNALIARDVPLAPLSP